MVTEQRLRADNRVGHGLRRMLGPRPSRERLEEALVAPGADLLPSPVTRFIKEGGAASVSECWYTQCLIQYLKDCIECENNVSVSHTVSPAFNSPKPWSLGSGGGPCAAS